MKESAESIATHLGAKKTGTGWVAQCPAHPDENPSLSISEGDNGKLLLKCHAGCTFAQIIAALGFKSSQKKGGEKRLKSMREFHYECDDEKKRGVKVRKDFHDGTKTFVWTTKPEGLKPYLYSKWKDENRIYFVEGEKCAEFLSSRGLPATTIGGANDWKASLARYFGGKELVLIPDNDQPGRNHIEAVFRDVEAVAASAVILELPGLAKSEDVVDWLDGRLTCELTELAATCPPPHDIIRKWNEQKLAIFTRLDTVMPREVEFIWPPYIPRSKITGLAGDPGIGKTSIVASLVAALSRGTPLPGCETAMVGDTVLFTAEDDIADTIVPRLKKLGADLSRIRVFPSPVQLNDTSFKEIRSAICAARPLLVVFDPIQSYIGNVDMHRANEVRGVLMELIKLARDLRCAIIIVMHMSKNNMKGTYRALGSIDFVAAIRSLLIAGRSSKDKSKHAMLHAKSNCGPMGPSLGYELLKGNFAWTGSTDLTEADILAAELAPNHQRKATDAMDFLYDLLKRGPMDSKDLKAAFLAAGFSERTIKRVKEEMGVESIKVGTKWVTKLRDDHLHF
jgi:hypothetical protein